MHRRDFLLTATSAAVSFSAASAAQDPAPVAKKGPAPFRLKYAPHFGMFGNHAPDLLDQLQFAADEGFSAWEDNGMPGRSTSTTSTPDGCRTRNERSPTHGCVAATRTRTPTIVRTSVVGGTVTDPTTVPLSAIAVGAMHHESVPPAPCAAAATPSASAAMDANLVIAPLVR